MGYFCRNCGEEDSFKGIRGYTASGTEIVYIDSEGDVTDYGDRDESDTDYDSTEDVECCSCGEMAEWLEGEELEEAVAEFEKGKGITNWKDEV